MDVRNFELIVDNLEKNPHCLHGPTLIFQKNFGKVKNYYACSACRDQKSCNFYLPVNEKSEILVKTSNFWKERQKGILSAIEKSKPHKKFIEILRSFKSNSKINKSYVSNTLDKSTKSESGYCYTCSCLFDKSNCTEHMNCNVLSEVTYYQLTHPTSIIIPKTDTKTHAQYFFSESSVNDIFLLLSRLKATKLLCIGVPKIHENALNNGQKMKSLLLDFDKNYFNFYSKNDFIWYNMFNNYIFDEKQEAVLHKFLKSSKLIVLIDPPFGGRVEPLARTLNMINRTFLEINKLHKQGNAELQVFWFFPYFMEKHVRDSLPNFRMFDYKVNYGNHSSFTDVGHKKRKFGSPVRIFTNVPLGLLDLEGVPGYKFCELCSFWVSNENKHCKECNACTSKDGRTYNHCSKCSKCVKPSYRHCDTCSRCCLESHICGEFQPDTNCYHCHQPGHKKKECPLLGANKRRNSATSEVSKKKRKIYEKTWC